LDFQEDISLRRRDRHDVRAASVAISKILPRTRLIRGADAAREFKERDKERKSALQETTCRLERESGATRRRSGTKKEEEEEEEEEEETQCGGEG